MTDLFATLPNRRSIINRRIVADRIETLVEEIGTGDSGKLRREIVRILADALKEGRAEAKRRLDARPTYGREAVQALAFLTDQVVRILYDVTTHHLYMPGNRTTAEQIALLAVGGYGRGEMAPYSDVDIAFVTPYKPTTWTEQVIESMLYSLWDLGFKVGHSSRSIDEMVRMSKADLTIRTAMLEARYVWGDREVYDEAMARFDAEVVKDSARTFVAEKLAERDDRHKRMGDSRYVVEPNVKEGKGGLRDLHTLFWIGKYVNRVRSVSELVDAGLLTPQELRQFQKAENFLWAVRCHLHYITRRAEDRLTFDLQLEVAGHMHFTARTGRAGVERFMHYYFLTAKKVGDLTAVFLAHLDDQWARKGRRFIPSITRRPRKLSGFVLDRGRIALPRDDYFAEDPVRLLEIFALADKHGLDVHPSAMIAASRDMGLIDNHIRRDERANAFFLDVLTSPRDPERALRMMNEAGVFGRFIPDFGRVVAQMQFDMYHHYTVDEHTIRAIGLLSRIERGELSEDHPLAAEIFSQILSRRVLYVAVLLHDIAKGRNGDHSILGAEVAEHLCPRLGLSAAETETVAWLVRHHLLMSATAFKRDLADYKTILDFTEVVQSVEWLRLLLVLTVVDIRAVGPGVWNGWKRQLLSDLYLAAEEVLRLGHKTKGREDRIIARKEALQQALGLSDADFSAYAARLPDSYILAEPADILVQNARQILAAKEEPLSIVTQPDAERGATLVSIYASDHPGLFYRLAGAIHLAGGSIMDARIHTLRDGRAIDNFLVQDPLGRPFDQPDQMERIGRAIEDALANRQRLQPRLEARPLPRMRAEAFEIAPNVLIDNKASNRFTVIEIHARDKPALLFNLAYALFQLRVTIHSAHITTYGERAVDTFYVTDLMGGKIESKSRLQTLERRLLVAAEAIVEKNEKETEPA
ncbi:MAG: [protein-PII] uridylyltransferase [Sphingobium sp.]|nr:[protein-PII] uridylyltransferase [Sphingobium sp.]